MTSNWVRQALCGSGQYDPDLWFREGDDQRRALHLCRSHCPVKDLCTVPGRFSHGVLAGVAYNQHGHKSDHQRSSGAGCRPCNEQRRAAAATLPQPAAFPNCGSYAGWKRHKRAGQIPCEACAAASLAYEAERRAARRAA